MKNNIQKETHLLTICLVAVVFLTIGISIATFISDRKITNIKNSNADSNSLYIKELETKIVYLESELSKWEDHAIRMKRICGLPDTVSWSYKQKVIHNIDTSKLN